jgi:hypothetical protein
LREPAPADADSARIGAISPAAMLRSVVFPEPDGPKSATMLPGKTEMLIFSIARSSEPSARTKLFDTPSNRIAVSTSSVREAWIASTRLPV